MTEFRHRCMTAHRSGMPALQFFGLPSDKFQKNAAESLSSCSSSVAKLWLVICCLASYTELDRMYRDCAICVT